MRPSRIATALALPALLALSQGCVNPFKPASPELPVAGSVVEDFHTPDDVLTTMQLAIEAKASGANAWLHAFAESTVVGDRAYRCFYDGAVKQSWQSSTSRQAPEPWDLGLERGLPSYLSGIRQSYQYAWQWSRDPSAGNDDDPAAADTAQFHRKYTLVATSTDGKFTDIIAIGFCDLSFQKTGARWSIYRWNDRVDPDVGVNPVITDERCMSWWRLESLAR